MNQEDVVLATLKGLFSKDAELIIETVGWKQDTALSLGGPVPWGPRLYEATGTVKHNGHYTEFELRFK